MCIKFHIFLFYIVTLLFNSSVIAQTLKFGDVDWDGDITQVDALIVSLAALEKRELSEVQKRLGDADGDGRLTQVDALILSLEALGRNSLTDLSRDVAIVETGDPTIPIIAAHSNGTSISVLTDETSGEMRGGIFTASNGDTYTLWLDDQGRPAVGLANDAILLFANHTNHTVDIALIDPDGNFQVLRNIEIDTRAPSGKLTKTMTPLSDRLNKLSWSLSVTGCAITAGLVVFTSGATLYPAALSCGSLVFKIRAVYAKSTALRNSNALRERILSTVQCALGDCISSVVDIVQGISRKTENIWNQYKNEHKNTIEDEGFGDTLYVGDTAIVYCDENVECNCEQYVWTQIFYNTGGTQFPRLHKFDTQEECNQDLKNKIEIERDYLSRFEASGQQKAAEAVRKTLETMRGCRCLLDM